MTCPHCSRPLELSRPPTAFLEMRAEPVPVCHHCERITAD